jgi:hypothetical protein
MKIKFLTCTIFLIVLVSGIVSGQVNCTRYWNKWNKPDKQIDSILSKVPIESLDTIFCDDYTINSDYNKDWYVDFYNRQFGKFFSKAINVNFNMFWYIQKNDSIKREIHITQFSFDSLRIEKIKPIIKSISKKFNNVFLVKIWTDYNYVFIKNDLFFICSEERYTHEVADMNFFDIVYKTFASFEK